jgi:hypothetical protein
MGKRLGKFEGELVVGKNLEILIGFSQGRWVYLSGGEIFGVEGIGGWIWWFVEFWLNYFELQRLDKLFCLMINIKMWDLMGWLLCLGVE